MQLISQLRSIWNGSIVRRLLLGICGLIVATTAAFTYVTVETQRAFIEQRNEERGMALVETLAFNSTSWVLINDLGGLSEIVKSAARYPDVSYIMILRPDGLVLAHSQPELVGFYVNDRSSLAVLHGAPKAREVARTPTLLDLASPIRTADRTIGWARIGLSQERVTESLGGLAWQGLYFGGIAVVLTVVLIFVVGGSLARSLNDLVAVTQMFAAGNFNARAKMKRRDEVGALADAFNTMAEILANNARELQTNEMDLRQLLTNLPVAILIRLPEGVFSYANAAARKTLNISEKEIESNQVFFPHWRFIHSDGSAVATDDVPSIRALRSKLPVVGHMLGVIPHGCTEPRWLHMSAYPELDVDGSVRRVIIAFLDLTDLRRVEEVNLQLSAAVEQSPVAVFTTDTHGVIRYVNPAFCSTTGYLPEEVIGRNPSILASGETPPDVYAALWAKINRGEVWRGTMRDKRKDGTLFWVDAVIAPIRDTSGVIRQFVSIQQDITQRKEAEERVEYLAHHDALTGLPNRRLGEDRMHWTMAHADRLKSKAVLMFLDLDGFKAVNDAHGHTIGDELLKEVTTRLQSCMRRTDTVARQGGDEFIIMLADIRDTSSILMVAGTILEQLAQPFEIEGFTLSVSGSIGIVVYPDDGTDWETLIKKADIAMYAAKDAGRNTYRFFTEQMNTGAMDGTQMRTKLQNALQQGEFILRYQPRINLKAGKITGFSAQLRWNSPELGSVPPDTCVPLAEESGLIVPIGGWMLREACRHAANWQKPGYPKMVVSVNMSAAQFRAGDVVATVTQALSDAGLDASCLELELPESLLGKDAASVLTALSQIKALGVSLTISALGTSFSGLSYLKQINPDKIKIDQAFVRDLVAGSSSAGIVTAIVQMARTLGMSTVADGVNDEAALELVRQHDCDLAQGLYYAVPMPSEQVPVYLREFAARAAHAAAEHESLKHA